MPDTYAELLSRRDKLSRQQAEIAKQLADMERAQRAGAIRKIRDLMDQYGLTPADLRARATTKHRKPDARRKVAPKYRDPDSGKTWSGRGLRPRWLRQALNAGKKLDDFALR